MAKTKRIKTIDAGDLHEAVIYTPPGRWDTPRQRAQKSKATTQAQNAMNLKNKRKRLEFLIAGNFADTDRFVTLTYSDVYLPRNRREARALLRDFLATLRTLRKRHGLGFKYIYTTEDRHGEGRIHHHVILTAATGDIEQLQSLWTYGDVEVKSIWEYGNERHPILAEYMTKERKPNGEQAYTCGKNMVQPIVRSEWVDGDCALIAPRGAIILDEGRETPLYSEYYHLKYLRPTRGGPPGEADKYRGAAPFGLVTNINFRGGRIENGASILPHG